jgi:clan AA aspartic protease (TIGR02281 family)
MKYLILFYFCLITITQAIAQDIVKMEKSGGVYLIPCKVNGVPLKFIFDTGASNVSISLTEALFMLKNGYLKESDIKGTVYYSIANGEIAEGTRINIQKIEVGKQTLYNVEASIVHSTEAPLLFGQSAMERFGKFTMDYSNSNLIINSNTNLISSEKLTNKTNIKSETSIDDLILNAKKNNGYCGCKESPNQFQDVNTLNQSLNYAQRMFIILTLSPSSIYDVDLSERKDYKIYDWQIIELPDGKKYERVLFILKNDPKKIKCKGCETKYDFQLVEAIQSGLQ